MTEGDRPGQNLATLGVIPPAAGASRYERRRFVRDLNARSAMVCAALLVVALIVRAAGWIVLVMSVAVIVVLLDVAWLTLSLRRLRQHGV